MTSRTAEPFDVLGPLPEGTVVLEASAGTGKTWTIAALATRYVAEAGLALSQLMLVTFGRAATQELRERTRARLTSAALGLADVEAARAGDDVLLAHLATGSDDEVAERRRRLVAALADFDAATITTTHSFCQRMLDGLGTAGDRELGVEVVESIAELVTEVADDLYVATFADHDGPLPQLTPAEARQVARDAVADRQAALVPLGAPADSAAGQRTALARRPARRSSAASAPRRARLRRPAGAAARRARRPGARRGGVRAGARALPGGARRRVPGHRPRAVGGAAAGLPRQHDAGAHRRPEAGGLRVPRRRGAQLPRGRGGGGPLRHAAAQLAQRRRAGRGPGGPLRRRRPGPRGHHGASGRGAARRVAAAGRGPAAGAPRAAHRLRAARPQRLPVGGGAAQRVAADLADELVRLFDTALLRTGAGSVRCGRATSPVLVRKRLHIAPVREALERAGIPSVLAGATSVFATPAAADWLHVLQALEQPQRPGRVRLAALTPLLGLTADRLDESATTATSAFLRELAQLFGAAGFAAVVERLATRTDLDARLLGRFGGERRLTDLRHLAQVLDRTAVEQSLGLTALTTWLAERVADPEGSSTADRSRRLESDAAAVQIITVHTSKGLEFPVVHVPFAWDAATSPSITRLLLHDDAGRRLLDLGGKEGPGWAERKRTSDTEAAGEELRLLYVALTRAQSQVVAWWAPGTRRRARRCTGCCSAARRASPSRQRDRQCRLTKRPPCGCRPGRPPPRGWSRSSRWARRPVPCGRRRSPTRRGSASPAPRAASTGSGAARRTRRSPPPRTRPPTLPSRASAASPAGREDRRADGRSGRRRRSTGRRRGAALADGRPARGRGLRHPRARGARARRHRRPRPRGRAARPGAAPPSAPGSPTSTPPRWPGSAAGAARHRSPAAGRPWPTCRRPTGCPSSTSSCRSPGESTPPRTRSRCSGWLRCCAPPAGRRRPGGATPDLLEALEAPPLRGYLSGSIDAVLRLPGPRYVVVDYKTNRLRQGPLTALDFGRPQMAAEMLHAHYPLQALLYAVALHRYLRWRQPGYDPAQHLGGIAYLFVRGMVGPDTPPGCGVFDWQPSAELVVALSDLLAGA
jgi:exodeoxyribonuclease V beta subunit